MTPLRLLLLSTLTASILGASALAQPAGDGSKVIPNPGSGGGARLGGPAAAPPVALDPKNNRLDALLLQWEEQTKGVSSVHVKDCTRTDKDPTGKSTKAWKGEARYLKPNLAAIRLIQADDPKFYELMVSTGTFLYEYRPQFKKLMVHELPQRGAGFENNLLSFLFGMNAADAKRRYDLKLTKDINEQNPHWIYIDVTPRFEADKREFTRAQLVLFAKTMLPRRLWFEHPNSSEVTWDLPAMDTTVQLTAMNFRPPDPPKDWETVRVPLEQAPPGRPSVVRPASQR